LGHQVFFDVKDGAAEVDQQSGFNSTGAEIAEELGHVFFGHRSRGLELNEQLMLDEQIRVHLTQERAVLIENIERLLLYYFETLFAEAMSQGILVDLLNVPVSVVSMHRKAGFPNRITQLIHVRKFHGALLF